MFDFSPAQLEQLAFLKDMAGMVGSAAAEIIRTPDLPAVLANGTDSQPVPLHFPGPGWVIGAMGSELAGTAPSYAGTLVRVQVGGSKDLISNGKSGDFAPYLMLLGFGSNDPTWRQFRHVDSTVDWYVTFRNRTGGNITPIFGVSYVSDEALTRMMQILRGR